MIQGNFIMAGNRWFFDHPYHRRRRLFARIIH